MDIQFFGANCLVFSNKAVRIVIDDNLVELRGKSILKADDIALFTTRHEPVATRLMFDGPGEYEVSDVSIVGIAARAHVDEAHQQTATMYKIIAGEYSILVTGHIHPDLNDKLLEQVGIVDIMVVPVGGSGYTLDPLGALRIIKEIEPKIIIPTHYAEQGLNYPVPQIELESALKELAMEPKERITKLRVKPGELTDITQLVVLEHN